MDRELHAMASQPSPSSSTTFVQADASTFRDLVQKLTGFSDNSHKVDVTIPLSFSSKPSFPKFPAPRRAPFKLHERRRPMRNLQLNYGQAAFQASEPNSQPYPSPVTPLLTDSVFCLSSAAESPSSPAIPDEGRAVAGEGFYLHQSPMSTPRMSERPELLILFPLSSPNQQTQE